MFFVCTRTSVLLVVICLVNLTCRYLYHTQHCSGRTFCCSALRDHSGCCVGHHLGWLRAGQTHPLEYPYGLLACHCSSERSKVVGDLLTFGDYFNMLMRARITRSSLLTVVEQIAALTSVCYSSCQILLKPS